ncbi:hypothetical protein AABB24_038038 [Solanum stoloniferum]|uniref:Uncharacterized protein n=1 Tax=Solanum stoloniferum TaxID=62892 RepID=A0ABD2QWX4_9SOLN
MDEQGNHTIVTRIFLRFQMYFVCTLVVISLSNFCVFFSKIPLTPFRMRRRDVYIGEILGFKLEGKRVKSGFQIGPNFEIFFPKGWGKAASRDFQLKSPKIRMKRSRGGSLQTGQVLTQFSLLSRYLLRVKEKKMSMGSGVMRLKPCLLELFTC